MSDQTLVIKNIHTLVTMDTDRQVLHDAWIKVQGNTIESLGSGTPPEGDRRINAGGHVVLPGLVNTHHHFFQTLLRGVPAMQNLYAMIGTAIAEVVPEEPVKKTIGASWSGYYVNDIFIGFRYNESLKVIFENHQGANPDFKRTLMMEDAHFFSLSAGEQLECLIEFLQEGFSAYDLHGGSAAGF